MPTPEHVFFIHNPKSGGTSIVFRFQTAMGLEHSMSQDILLPEDESEWTQFSKYKFIHGHGGYEFFEKIQSLNHVLITNFRHPVERLISLYDYWRHNIGPEDRIDEYMAMPNPPYSVVAPYLARTLSFSDFLRHDEPKLAIYNENMHARQLLHSMWKTHPINMWDIYKLKQRIFHMHWYYICEYPSLSEAWFKKQFPNINVPMRKENVTTYTEIYPRTKPTTEDVTLILKKNSVDIQLYNYAIALLHKRFTKPK